MKRTARPLPLLALAFALLVPAAAHGVLITVDFSVLADPTDPSLAGQTSSGFFSFDSSLIPNGGGQIIDLSGLGLTSFSFTWDGHTWSSADADAIMMHFRPDGTLLSWDIGGAPAGFGNMGMGVFPDFVLLGEPLATATYGGLYDFQYSTADSPQLGIFISGSVTSWSVTTAPSVPEPGTLSLVGLGLLPLAMIHRRKR